MTKNEYKKWLENLLIDEEPNVKIAPLHEVIYIIDDLHIYGGFECGVRGIDHNFLKNDDVSWEDIFEWGTLVVPERKTYSSKAIYKDLENIGYSQL